MTAGVFLLAERHASVSKFTFEPADSWCTCKFSLTFCPATPGGDKRALTICACFKVSLNSHIWLSISCLHFFLGQAFVPAPTHQTVVSHDTHKVRVGPEGFFCPHETDTVCWPCYLAMWFLHGNILFYGTDCACKTSHNVIHRSQVARPGGSCLFLHVAINIFLLDQYFCICLH
jgi:hypothetical protein